MGSENFWKVKIVKSFLYCLTFKLWRNFIWGTIPFSWGRGTGGICAVPFKNHVTPLSLPIFLHALSPLIVLIISDDAPLSKKNPSQDFNLIFSIISLLLFVIVFTMKKIFTNPISAESCFLNKKYKSKGREVNISDLLVTAYPELVAFGLWFIGIFLIWIDEGKSDITWVIFSPRVSGIAAILVIVTFIRFTAVNSCPVVIFWHFSVLFYQLWEYSSAASMIVLQLPLLSHSAALRMLLQPVVV